jgi:hypothetical protein
MRLPRRHCVSIAQWSCCRPTSTTWLSSAVIGSGLWRCKSLSRLVEWFTVEWVFDGEIIEWRGPAPYYFVAMSESDSAELKEEARSLIYWGQVPVRVVIGDTEFTTALFPREGRYLVPLKDTVRKAENVGTGDVVSVVLTPEARQSGRS